MHQIIEEGHEIVVKWGAELGVGPSDTESGFVVWCRLPGHGSTVVGDSLAIQKTIGCLLIEGG
jgi:hypothetical protein